MADAKPAYGTARVTCHNKTKIQDSLEFCKGSGVQHIAIATDNIVDRAYRLQNQVIEFLTATTRGLAANLHQHKGRPADTFF